MRMDADKQMRGLDTAAEGPSVHQPDAPRDTGSPHTGSQPDDSIQTEDHLVELAVEVFAMFADATRLRIVLALRGGELPVNDIAQAVGKSPSAVSQHLAKLRMARLVSTRQDGTRVYYRLTNEHVRELVTDAIYQAEHVADGFPRLHHHAAESGPDPVGAPVTTGTTAGRSR